MILCMNAATGGVTEWDLDWLGVAEHDGVIYGVTEDALESLDGESETDFSGAIRTGELTFGTDRDKRVPKAYFELEQSDTVAFTASYASYGNLTDHDYPLVVRATDATENATYRREDLARGERGQWWAFGLSGADWHLGALRMLSKPVSRRF